MYRAFWKFSPPPCEAVYAFFVDKRLKLLPFSFDFWLLYDRVDERAWRHKITRIHAYIIRLFNCQISYISSVTCYTSLLSKIEKRQCRAIIFEWANAFGWKFYHTHSSVLYTGSHFVFHVGLALKFNDIPPVLAMIWVCPLFICLSLREGLLLGLSQVGKRENRMVYYYLPHFPQYLFGFIPLFILILSNL